MLSKAELADARAKTTCGNPNCDTCRLPHRIFDHIDAQAARLAVLETAGDAMARQMPALLGAIHDGHDGGYSYVNDAMVRGHEALNAWRAARKEAADA